MHGKGCCDQLRPGHGMTRRKHFHSRKLSVSDSDGGGDDRISGRPFFRNAKQVTFGHLVLGAEILPQFLVGCVERLKDQSGDTRLAIAGRGGDGLVDRSRQRVADRLLVLAIMSRWGRRLDRLERAG